MVLLVPLKNAIVTVFARSDTELGTKFYGFLITLGKNHVAIRQGQTTLLVLHTF